MVQDHTFNVQSTLGRKTNFFLKKKSKDNPLKCGKKLSQTLSASFNEAWGLVTTRFFFFFNLHSNFHPRISNCSIKVKSPNVPLKGVSAGCSHCFRKLGFLLRHPMDILSRIILCWGSPCAIWECLAASLISAHDTPVIPLSLPLLVTTQNISSHCHLSFRGQNGAQL